MRDYALLMAGSSAFLFVSHTVAAEKMWAKAHLWENALRGNVQLSMAKYLQLLAVNSGPCHVD